MKHLKKYLGRKKRGEQPKVSETTSPSGVATIPNQPTRPPTGAAIFPNEPILPPSGENTPPNEPTARETDAPPIETADPPSKVAPLSNETAVPPSQTTAPAPEAIVPSSKESNFWQKAVEALPKEYEVPDEWRTAEIDSEEVIGMVKTKIEECKDRQWKTEINGKEITVREVFGKTLDWVKPFVAVGDAAAQLDPFNAGLPWAGFRFLLQVAVNDRETYGAMVAGFERATWLTTYCWAQECLYKEYFAANDKYSGLNNAFVEDLTHLYTAILRFLIQAHRYYTKGTIARIGVAIISPSSWVENLTRAIDSRKLRMEDYASLVHKSNVHQGLKDVLGRLEVFSKYTSEEAARREEEERQDFMKWLSDIDYRGDHETNSRNILKDSGDWLLSREEKFRSWKEEGGVLWLRGIPGAGKTKLTSTIIDHLMKTDENHMVAYFYCVRDTKQPKKEDPEEILRAILKQLVILLPTRLSDPVKEKYEDEKRKGRDHGLVKSLKFEECAHFIGQLARIRPITIVIDALDECRESKYESSRGSHTDRRDLLKELIATKHGNVKVFLSSRDDVDIKHRLQNYPNITITASKNGDDILRFIKSEVDDLIMERSDWGSDKSLKEEIIAAVDDRANGMFRFASLQISYLSSLNTRSGVRQRLRNLPTTLRELYDEIYGKISAMVEEESSIAKRALSWLLCAYRQLRSSELLAAVSPDPDQRVNVDELLRLCRHLVILDEVSDSFELAHLSVREYLETHDEYKDGQPHAVVAELCIKLFEPEVPQGTLDQYASLYWADHYNSRPQTGEDAVTDTAKNFFRGNGVNPAFKKWAKLAEASAWRFHWSHVAARLRDARYKPLSVVCVFGFSEILDQCMDTIPGYSYFRSSNDMVVHFAIKWGNEEVVRLLLQFDAQPAIDMYGLTGLFWAAIYEQLPVLEVMKELHGGVDAEDDMEWTALDWMVILGRIEGVKLLLKLGAGTNMTDQAKWTPLHWAACLDREAETRELVGKYRGDTKDCDGLTPFQWAEFLGHKATAQHLRTSEAGGSYSSSFRVSPVVKAEVRYAKQVDFGSLTVISLAAAFSLCARFVGARLYF